MHDLFLRMSCDKACFHLPKKKCTNSLAKSLHLETRFLIDIIILFQSNRGSIELMLLSTFDKIIIVVSNQERDEPRYIDILIIVYLVVNV